MQDYRCNNNTYKNENHSNHNHHHHRHPHNDTTKQLVSRHMPQVKDKLGDLSVNDNYRAIMLITVISKLIGKVLTNIRMECLHIDDRRFGFKKNVGCIQAILTVHSAQLLG
jgi:hypothetical protein